MPSFLYVLVRWVHGAPGEVEEAGDLRVRAAVGGQAGDAQLASGEGAGAGADGGGAAGPAFAQGRLREGPQPDRTQTFGLPGRCPQALPGPGAFPGGGELPAQREQSGDQLSKSALPHRLTATVTGKDGRTTTRRLTLDQGAGPQRRAFRVGEVTAVRFTIESAYGTSAKKQVAIAEIEFFGPSSANST
jgi:hypothetical protein